MKNNDVVNAYDSINPDDDIRGKVARKISQKQRLKRQIYRLAGAGVAALFVVCLAVFIFIDKSPLEQQEPGLPGQTAVIESTQPAPDSAPDNAPDNAGSVQTVQAPGNSFAFAAYLVSLPDAGPDGVNEFSLVGQHGLTNVYANYNQDRRVFHAAIGLSFEGLEENDIISIVISVDEGYFARLKPIILTPVEGAIYHLGLDLIADIDSFESIGNEVNFGVNGIDLINVPMMYWVLDDVDDMSDIPASFDVHARAVLNDGTEQESTVTIDLRHVLYLRINNEQVRLHLIEMLEYYMNIPLDDCELVPESVRTFTDVYRYEVGSSIYEVSMTVTQLELSEEGLREIGSFTREFHGPDGLLRTSFGDFVDDGDERGYLVVIRDEGDGVYTGMLYRTPVRP